MTRSPEINELAAALAKAQAEIEGAKKDSSNPFFRARYADLASVWEACRAALSKNGLAVLQSPTVQVIGTPEATTKVSRASGEERDEVRALASVTVATLLLHASGQWIADELACFVASASPQAIGSGITYLRRYALAAFVGVAPADEDDDGEAAMGRASSPAPREPEREAEPVTVTGKVLGIVQRKAGAGTKYVITLADHKTYGTFHKSHAETAKAAQAAGVELEITYRPMRWGNDIATLRDPSLPEPEF